MIAICWLIDKSLGDGDTAKDFENLTAFCRKLGYDQGQFDEAVQEAKLGYAKDAARA